MHGLARIAIVGMLGAPGCSDDPCDMACVDAIHVTAHSDTAIQPSQFAMVGLCIDQACGTGKYDTAQLQLAGVMSARGTVATDAAGMDVTLEYTKGAMLHDGNVFGLDVYDDGVRVSAISDPVMYTAACSCKTLELALVLVPRI